MARRRIRSSIFVMAALLAGLIVVSSPAAAAGKGNGVVRHAAKVGTTKFSASKTSSGAGSIAAGEIAPGNLDAAGGGTSSHNSHGVNRSRSIELGSAPVTGAPVAAGVGVSSTGPVPVNASFDGLNHFDQRFGSTAGVNQFSLEPPDQGLCVGNGFVVEALNDVITVYSPAGNDVAPVEDLNSFFGYALADVRSIPVGTPGRFGPFVTDPSCYYDPVAQRWFVDILTLDVFSDSGDFKGTNHLDIAVSQSADPTGGWNLYSIDVTDDGSNGVNHNCVGIAPYGQATTPTNPNACLGDYPHLGADANGIFLTTNEYSFFGNTFHGAQVYALSKADLVAGSTLMFKQFDTNDAVTSTQSGFTLWPATASGGNFSTADGGTEYFLSSNAADEAHGDGSQVGPRRSNQILEWSVTGTSFIDSSPASVALSSPTALPLGLYVVPAGSEQKVGPTPLIDCLNQKACATNVAVGFPDFLAPEHEYAPDSNDTRMQQVDFANGKLWGALDTGVSVGGSNRAGIAYYVVNPSANKVMLQGYVADAGFDYTYPAIGVLQNGRGVMAFTATGDDLNPSSGYTSMDAKDGAGDVHIVDGGQGAAPDDGFTGYRSQNNPPGAPPRTRWGDYSATAVDGNSIWIASEYIGGACSYTDWGGPFFVGGTGDNLLGTCGGATHAHGVRTSIANWSTRISQLKP